MPFEVQMACTHFKKDVIIRENNTQKMSFEEELVGKLRVMAFCLEQTTLLFAKTARLQINI